MGRFSKRERFGGSTSEMTPLNPQRDSSNSSNDSETSRRGTTSYGSFFPSYLSFFRNTLRRSRSLQVGYLCLFNKKKLLMKRSSRIAIGAYFDFA